MIIKNGYLKPSDASISSVPFDELRIARISINSPDNDFKQDYITYVIDYIKGDFYHLKKIDKILKDGLQLEIIGTFNKEIATIASSRGVILHNKLSDIDGWVQFPITTKIILHTDFEHSEKKQFFDTSGHHSVFSRDAFTMYGVEEMVSFLCYGIHSNESVIDENCTIQILMDDF